MWQKWYHKRWCYILCGARLRSTRFTTGSTDTLIKFESWEWGELSQPSKCWSILKETHIVFLLFLWVCTQWAKIREKSSTVFWILLFIVQCNGLFVFQCDEIEFSFVILSKGRPRGRNLEVSSHRISMFYDGIWVLKFEEKSFSNRFDINVISAERKTNNIKIFIIYIRSF